MSMVKVFRKELDWGGRKLVMESGRVVEHGATAQVFGAPQAPATQRLLQAAQRLQISDSPAEGGGL